MQPETNPISPPPTKSPRSIPKAITALLSGCFWVGWDYFWKLFNLDAVGDEMKEHSSNLNKKRAGVLVVLIIVAFIGAYVDSRFHKKQIGDLKTALTDANDTITQLRNYNAGRPHKESPAELMGLHDETNYTVLTNSILFTNLITEAITFYGSHPILDFFQMSRISQKSKSDSHLKLLVVYGDRDTNSIELAKQITQVFSFSGYDASAFMITNQIQNQLPRGLSIASKKYPVGQVSAGFIQLCNELNQRVSWTPAPTLDDNNFWITVNLSY
jgi:hypothetical protein